MTHYQTLGVDEKPIRFVHKEWVKPGAKPKGPIHICGAPYKSKPGNCKCKGQKKYGWYCGHHKNYATILPKNID